MIFSFSIKTDNRQSIDEAQKILDDIRAQLNASESTGKPKPIEDIPRISNLRYVDGLDDIFNSWDHVVRQGSVLAICGGRATGKTTLAIRLILQYFAFLSQQRVPDPLNVMRYKKTFIVIHTSTNTVEHIRQVLVGLGCVDTIECGDNYLELSELNVRIVVIQHIDPMSLSWADQNREAKRKRSMPTNPAMVISDGTSNYLNCVDLTVDPKKRTFSVIVDNKSDGVLRISRLT